MIYKHDPGRKASEGGVLINGYIAIVAPPGGIWVIDNDSLLGRFAPSWVVLIRKSAISLLEVL